MRVGSAVGNASKKAETIYICGLRIHRYNLDFVYRIVNHAVNCVKPLPGTFDSNNTELRVGTLQLFSKAAR